MYVNAFFTIYQYEWSNILLQFQLCLSYLPLCAYNM